MNATLTWLADRRLRLENYRNYAKMQVRAAAKETLTHFKDEVPYQL